MLFQKQKTTIVVVNISFFLAQQCTMKYLKYNTIISFQYKWHKKSNHIKRGKINVVILKMAIISGS